MTDILGERGTVGQGQQETVIVGGGVIVGQPNGPDNLLYVTGEGFYETTDGYTVVNDALLGLSCYALLEKGALVSSRVPISAAPPAGIAPHLHGVPEIRGGMNPVLQVFAGEAASALPIHRWVNKNPIHIAGAGTVASVRVAVDITHPRIGDLIVMLLPPAGADLWLHNLQGGDTHDLRATYDSVGSHSPLASLAGQAMQGDWSLAVIDVRVDPPGSRGTIDKWWLMITPAQ